MLDECVLVDNMLSFTFSAAKSFCMSVRKLALASLSCMSLGNDQLFWVPNTKYVGVHVVAGEK